MNRSRAGKMPSGSAERSKAMKILLVYPNVMGVERIHLGLGYISACLKEKGHEVALLDTTFGVTEADVVRAAEGVDLVGVSVMTLQLDQAVWVSGLVREATEAPIVWGGNHPTVRPGQCIEYGFVDIVCVGEGEDAMTELAARLERGEDITRIPNLWVKKDGQLHRNALRPLIRDLDSLPWPDRGAFDPRHLRVESGSIVSGSRECPYGCGYCINDTLKRLYKGKGKYVRHRSVDSLLDEFEAMRDRYGVRYFEFADETFTLRRKWVFEFCEKYKRRIGLPFIFQTRCNDVDTEVLSAIKDAGCDTVSFGVESGNEEYRNKVLGRKMTDETIFEAFRIAREVGFKVCSFNMVGMPYETEEMILDTIRINKRLKPDIHNVCIFYPFPGTRLGDICEREGWISDEAQGLESYYYDTVLRMPQLDRYTILVYQKFFPLFLKLPEFSYPVFTRLFKTFLKAAYALQSLTGSKLLKELMNNLYWFNSAMTQKRLLGRLLRSAPGRIAKLRKKRAYTVHSKERRTADGA